MFIVLQICRRINRSEKRNLLWTEVKVCRSIGRSLKECLLQVGKCFLCYLSFANKAFVNQETISVKLILLTFYSYLEREKRYSYVYVQRISWSRRKVSISNHIGARLLRSLFLLVFLIQKTVFESD